LPSDLELRRVPRALIAAICAGVDALVEAGRVNLLRWLSWRTSRATLAGFGHQLRDTERLRYPAPGDLGVCEKVKHGARMGGHVKDRKRWSELMQPAP
jgi:hypothetical protein